jgi:DNA-binding NarL/FixJ family response regulator
MNNRFGSKVNKLFNLIDETDNWERYVSNKTVRIIKTLRKNQSMKDTLRELDMKYTTARAHLVRAIKRIKNKKTKYLRKGQSKKAQQLFELMETTSNWKEPLTDREVKLANFFKRYKNFHKVGRKLSLAPSNIAGTLYGNSQKLGVIGKLKEYKYSKDKKKKG